MNPPLLLTEKYRPKRFDDLILPDRQAFLPVFSFLQNPFPSAWLFSGKSGLGKTSLARIMASQASNPVFVQQMVGPQVDGHQVQEWEKCLGHFPLYGKFHSFIIDEADAITAGAQIRLLSLLEKNHNAVIIFTSNDQIDDFEPRFLSRLKCLSFTSQGLAEPAVRWLIKIATQEGLSLRSEDAEKIVRHARNNLRACLQTLELRLLSRFSPSLDPCQQLSHLCDATL